MCTSADVQMVVLVSLCCLSSRVRSPKKCFLFRDVSHRVASRAKDAEREAHCKPVSTRADVAKAKLAALRALFE